MAMKKVISICLGLLVFSFLTAFRSSDDADTLKVEIAGLRSSEGVVLVSLFKDGKGYPDEPEKAFKKSKISITDNKASIDFANLPPGEYAIVVLHDENNNLKMDKNLGIPKEGYGFSNNVMGLMGPPSFSKASFKHEGKQVVAIRMRY
jgi:uncharacterized protein (DUF2141 family)